MSNNTWTSNITYTTATTTSVPVSISTASGSYPAKAKAPTPSEWLEAEVERVCALTRGAAVA